MTVSVIVVSDGGEEGTGRPRVRDPDADLARLARVCMCNLLTERIEQC